MQFLSKYIDWNNYRAILGDVELQHIWMETYIKNVRKTKKKRTGLSQKKGNDFDG